MIYHRNRLLILVKNLARKLIQKLKRLKKFSAVKKLALEVRKRAMETIGQTSTRSESGKPVDRIKERKKRRSRGNTLAKKEKKNSSPRFEV